MTGTFPLIRFLRDSELTLRQIAESSPGQIASDLLQIANSIALHATQLLTEITQAGVPPG